MARKLGRRCRPVGGEVQASACAIAYDVACAQATVKATRTPAAAERAREQGGAGQGVEPWPARGRLGVVRGRAAFGHKKAPESQGFRGFLTAETGGFEPPVEFNPDPSLAVKSIRPLWHVSM